MTPSPFQTRSIGITTIGFLASLGIVSFASADPLPNEQLKFFQSPLNGGPPGVYPVGAVPLPTDTPAPFLGQDVFSTATTADDGQTFTGTMAADDFLDTNPNPIGHITFWGSYVNNTDPGTTGPGVTAFDISLYSDVPATTNSASGESTPSHPGNLIASQVVRLGALSSSSGTFTATPVAANGPGAVPPGDSGLYQYNAELNWKAVTFPDADANNANAADPDQVEWLSIVALVPAGTSGAGGGLQWGWHDRDYGIADPYAAAGFETNSPNHGGDDAVSGSFSAAGGNITSGASGYSSLDYNPEYDGINSSMDLAFALYTVPTSVPEPATLGLLGLTIPMLLKRHRKPRSS